MDADILSANASQLARLERLVARLSPADLARDLGEGWTVSAALGHLAFWDSRARLILELLGQGKPLPAGDFEWYESDLLNTALTPQWRALPPAEAARLALDAARSVNDTVVRVSKPVEKALIAADTAWLLRRANHRGEHIDQVERALAG